MLTFFSMINFKHFLSDILNSKIANGAETIDSIFWKKASLLMSFIR